jgi:Coenzyme PQQ synthesis protein D (PqqD)
MTAGSYETRNRKNQDVSSVTGDHFLVRSRAVVSRCVAGETLIVPVRGRVGDLASIYSFNETGSLIWKLLETPRTLGEIAAALAQEFDVTREQAESDATRFVSEMFAVDLVEVSEVVAGTEGPVGREGLAAAGAR